MTYKKGSLPPSGYVQWHDWAQDQLDYGLTQTQCPGCKLWLFPQEKPKHEGCTQASAADGAKDE